MDEDLTRMSTSTAPSQEEEDSRESRMRVARLFESNSSVNDILKDTLFKSVVSNELNSLSSVGATTETTTDIKPPALPTRSTSSTSSGAFMQAVLATLSSKQGAGAGTQPPQPPRLSGLASTTSATLASKPSAKAIEDLTSSRNWDNLGSHEDINVSDVFKTQQDNDATANAKRKRKTNWDAVMKQGLQAATAAAAACQENGASTSEKKGKTNWDAVMKQGLEAATAAALASVASSAASAAPPAQSPKTKPTETVVKTEVVVPTVVSSVEPSSQTKSGSAKKRGRTDQESTPATKPAPKSSSKKEGSGSKERVFVKPADNDVLLGRGGRANNHPGNKRYLELKDSIQDRYMAADKSQKTQISQELVDIVNKEWKGRFLKQDSETKLWYEVDNVTARKKCSQTLREVNTAEVRAAKRARYAK